MLWALVFLVGLIITHFMWLQNLDEMAALWAWLIIILGANFSIGKSYGKKWPAEVAMSWNTVTALFIVLAGTMLLGVWPGGATVFFALYFVLFGAAMFASSHEMKMSSGVTWGLIYVALGIVYPLWFVTAPFLAAGLILGLPMLIESSVKKKK